MTVRTFGKKGAAAADFGAAPSRRTGFGQRNPDHFEAIEIDEGALRRAAFVAEERARNGLPAEAAPRRSALPPVPLPETDRSLDHAWIIWLLAGLAGGHRFYLRRPITGGLQALLFVGSWIGALLGWYAAFAGVGVACLWMIADGFLLKRLHLHSGERY